VKAEAIIEKIRASIPDAEVELEDLTGTEDHWKAVIVSAAFDGKNLLTRQRLVLGALAEEMKGPIHALSMDTWTPEEVRTRVHTR
jgi:stress-induced morphogen